MLKIGIVAAESSGDLVGAGLMRAIKMRCPSVIFEGIAGPCMIAEGCVPLFKVDQLSVMGVFEVLAKLPEILSIRRAIKRHFASNVPDIFIGVDAPDFNLPIEGFLRKKGVKTVHYNSPTLWAWRKNRIKVIQKTTSLMLTLFPFETAIYEAHNVPVKFIGHPLADSISANVDVQKSREVLGIETAIPAEPSEPYAMKVSKGGKIIAILPGSRAAEVKQLGRLFLKAAQWCLVKDPTLKFVVPMVSEARLVQFRAICADLPPNFPIQFFVAHSRVVIAAADAVLLASGTATLETALLQKPMVVAYRFNAFNYQIARLFIKVPYFALPNLLLNKLVVPEFFQDQATPERLGAALLEQLDRGKEVVLLNDFKYLRQLLAQSADEKAARAVLGLLSL